MSSPNNDFLLSFDRELASAVRASGVLRLRLGQALELLSARGWHHELGYSSLEAYAYERCERSGRWAADMRSMARRLAVFPTLRCKLVKGDLGWSMVELLARHATPETEQALALQAAGSTVREMRAHFGAVAQSEEPEFRTITATVDREEVWIFDCTRLLVEHVDGRTNADRMLHAMLAEATSSLLELLPDGALAAFEPGGGTSETSGVRDERPAESVARAAAPISSQSTKFSSAAEPANPGKEATSHPKLHTLDGVDEEAYATPEKLDAHIRKLAAALARRDVTIGILSMRLLQAGDFRLLGFSDEAAYARERLGLSLSSLKARRALAAKIQRLPALGAALARGRIGYVASTLIARIATPRTVAAWVERATERTVKHLREEVEAAELLVRIQSLREQLPPGEDVMQALANARRNGMELLAKSTEARELERLASKRGQMSVGSNVPVGPRGKSAAIGTSLVGPSPEAVLKPSTRTNSSSVQMSGGYAGNPPHEVMESGRLERPSCDPALRSNGTFGRVTLRFRVSADTFEFWKALERCFSTHRHSVSRDPVSFLHFLCISFWRSWGSVVVPKVSWAHIFARDGFRCLSPVCSRRDAHAHHLEFRSRGGGDHDENLGSLCTWCHLLGVHEGRIVALPPASMIRWWIGRKHTLSVLGRHKLAA